MPKMKPIVAQEAHQGHWQWQAPAPQGVSRSFDGKEVVGTLAGVSAVRRTSRRGN